MKVVTLHGSPHKHGNSDTLASYVHKGLNDCGQHEFQDFFLNEMNIKPCQMCMYCASSMNHTCKIQDDMHEIYYTFQRADLIIFTSPMFWGYMIAQLKIALDRLEAMVYEAFSNKVFVALGTYRHHVKSYIDFFERIAPHFDIKLYTLTCCTYDQKTNRDIPITEIPEILNNAYQLGRTLTKDFHQ